MIYFFRVEYKSYYSIEVSDLPCPLSGAVEPMRLVLYQKEAETTMSKQYVKKPSGVFFRISDNKDVLNGLLRWRLFSNSRKQRIPFLKKE